MGRSKRKGRKQDQAPPPRRLWRDWRFVSLSALILLAVGGIATISATLPDPKPVSSAPPARSAPVQVPGLLPENPRPWQYHAATDQHFDPTPGHNHWHSGPPPTDRVAQQAQQGQPIQQTFSASPPGQPWEYNAETNQHYDPRPGHQHWHSGPPPPPEDR